MPESTGWTWSVSSDTHFSFRAAAAAADFEQRQRCFETLTKARHTVLLRTNITRGYSCVVVAAAAARPAALDDDVSQSLVRV